MDPNDDDLEIPTEVKVLILTFAFNDLKLDDEITQTRTSFERLGYTVTDYRIPMVETHQVLGELETFLTDDANPQDGQELKAQEHEAEEHEAQEREAQEVERRRTLHIFYYLGHAGAITTNQGPELELARYVFHSKDDTLSLRSPNLVC